ncbi:MAG: SHOCT domain-containing protein [Clostridiales Family XIII bacterium]|jgi:hypothetical protein|nr:SHOCT domain-containing protein [Clostridiales Family XIII bacterium]
MSTADELLKLKQLLDEGLITQYEFDQQKSDILGNGFARQERENTNPFYNYHQPSYPPPDEQWPQNSHGASSTSSHMRKSMKVWGIVCFCLAALGLIMTDGEMAIVMTILGVMFVILARSQKGDKYLKSAHIGRMRIKKSTFVIACIIIASMSTSLISITQNESSDNSANSTSKSESTSSDGSSDTTAEDVPTIAPEAWLEFDARAWEDYKVLYQMHNSLMDYVGAYGNAQISTLEFYNKCKEFYNAFGTASLSYGYGSNDVEKDYLDLYAHVATSDQLAAKNILKYLDSNDISDFSKANACVEKAKEGMIMIASNRGLLLQKAGLTEEEITAKVDAEYAELDAA